MCCALLLITPKPSFKTLGNAPTSLRAKKKYDAAGFKKGKAFLCAPVETSMNNGYIYQETITLSRNVAYLHIEYYANVTRSKLGKHSKTML